MFPGEGKAKMSVEEQMDRMRRRQSGSTRDKRRSLQLPASPAPDPGARPARHGQPEPDGPEGGGGFSKEGPGRTQARQLGDLGKLLPRWAEDILQQVFASFVF